MKSFKSISDAPDKASTILTLQDDGSPTPVVTKLCRNDDEIKISIWPCSYLICHGSCVSVVRISE